VWFQPSLVQWRAKKERKKKKGKNSLHFATCQSNANFISSKNHTQTTGQLHFAYSTTTKRHHRRGYQYLLPLSALIPRDQKTERSFFLLLIARKALLHFRTSTIGKRTRRPTPQLSENPVTDRTFTTRCCGLLCRRARIRPSSSLTIRRRRALCAVGARDRRIAGDLKSLRLLRGLLERLDCVLFS
jgi:hypothetical protein